MVCDASSGEIGTGMSRGLLPDSLVYWANELQANKRSCLKKKMLGSYGMIAKVVSCLLQAQARAHTCTTPTMDIHASKQTKRNRKMNNWGLRM